MRQSASRRKKWRLIISVPLGGLSRTGDSCWMHYNNECFKHNILAVKMIRCIGHIFRILTFLEDILKFVTGAVFWKSKQENKVQILDYFSKGGVTQAASLQMISEVFEFLNALISAALVVLADAIKRVADAHNYFSHEASFTNIKYNTASTL